MLDITEILPIADDRRLPASTVIAIPRRLVLPWRQTILHIEEMPDAAFCR